MVCLIETDPLTTILISNSVLVSPKYFQYILNHQTTTTPRIQQSSPAPNQIFCSFLKIHTFHYWIAFITYGFCCHYHFRNKHAKKERGVQMFCRICFHSLAKKKQQQQQQHYIREKPPKPRARQY